MWLLNFLPAAFVETIIYGILIFGFVSGIVGFILSSIPTTVLYAPPLKVISIISLFFGVYLLGVDKTQNYYQSQIAQLKSQIQTSITQSNDANTVITTKVQDTVNQVITIKSSLDLTIKDDTKIIDGDCSLDPSVITILNKAAEPPLVTPTTTTSGKTN